MGIEPTNLDSKFAPLKKAEKLIQGSRDKLDNIENRINEFSAAHDRFCFYLSADQKEEVDRIFNIRMDAYVEEILVLILED